MQNIQVYLTESQLADEFVAAIAARNLPEKFLYWFPLSVRAWLNLCSEGPYKNFSRSQRLLVASAEDIVARLGSGPYEVISFGPGDGRKDRFIVERFGAKRVTQYLAVDASQALLEIAMAALQETGCLTLGVKADLANAEHWSAFAPKAETPRLVLLLGNTLGAFDPLDFASRLIAWLRPQDRLLVDGEIFCDDTMAGYDNPINRQFAFAPWRSIGVSESDGELSFVASDDPRRPDLYLIAKDFRPARDLELSVSGERLKLSRGERVAMSSSYKYSQQSFCDLWRGGRIEATYLTEDKHFCMALIRTE